MHTTMDFIPGNIYNTEIVEQALTAHGFEPRRMYDHVIAAMEVNSAETIFDVLSVVSWVIEDGVALIINGNEMIGYTYAGQHYDDAEWRTEKSINGNGWTETGMCFFRYDGAVWAD